MDLPLLSLDEQQAIASFLDRETAGINRLVGKVGEGIERLKEYRTALISAAVTGKIDVRGKSQTPQPAGAEPNSTGQFLSVPVAEGNSSSLVISLYLCYKTSVNKTKYR